MLFYHLLNLQTIIASLLQKPVYNHREIGQPGGFLIAFTIAQKFSIGVSN